MNAATVRAKLYILADAEGSQSALAHKIGVSQSFLSHILRHRCEPSGKVLSYLNLKKTVNYVQQNNGRNE